MVNAGGRQCGRNSGVALIGFAVGKNNKRITGIDGAIDFCAYCFDGLLQSRCTAVRRVGDGNSLGFEAAIVDVAYAREIAVVDNR